MRWAQITLESELGAVDAVGNCLNEIGCNGFMVEDQFSPIQVSGYVPVDDRLETRLDELTEALVLLPVFGVQGACTEITVRFVEEDDWANAWKAFYKPMRIGRSFIVTPPWETYPPTPSLKGSGESGSSDVVPQPDDLVIVMDPGMAFGTGSHPTTQLCLAAVEDFVQPGARVADIGTGSGILAIGAAKRGASIVDACDNDPLAVSIARGNADVNGAAISFSETLPGGVYDVIVANILADVIIGMAGDLALRLAPGATLIVSGIIDTREDDVKAALSQLTLLEVRRQSEWVAIVLRNGMPSA